MWAAHVLSKTEQAISAVESALREIENTEEDVIFDDLMRALGRLCQARRNTQRRRDEERHG